MGNRWRNSPIWHATWPKCGRSGSELRSAQCTTFVLFLFQSRPADHISFQLNAQIGGLIPITHLKHHFNVSNSYVIRKLRLVVFPWRHKPWTRKMRRSETGSGEFQPPRDDLNAPDLYIPGAPSLLRHVSSILLRHLSSYGFCDLYTPGCLTVGSAISFSPRNFRRCCDQGNRRPHT